MGKLAVYRYALLMFLIAQIVVSIFTFIGLFGGDTNPVGHTASAMMVFALPVFIICNFVLLLYWLCRRKWLFGAIPFITLIACIPYIGTIFQPFPKKTDTNETGGLKIATYNVARFGRAASGFIAQDILSEMKKENVDVLCIQEYSDESGDNKNNETYKEYFPYMVKGNSDMAIFSRYPITGVKNLPFEYTNNSAMWANIDVNGKLIKVFNVHLETTGFNGVLHQVAKNEMKGMETKNNAIIEAIYGTYTLGMIVRAGQAERVTYERRQSRIPTIVCGDFNDVPYSYVYNTLLDDMKDGFKECGSGWMYTFRGAKSVRIDYIFHDKRFEGINYYTTPLTYSDHLPVFMKIKL